MTVLHIQSSMTPAGNAAYRLSMAMRKHGIDSKVLNLRPSSVRDFAYMDLKHKGGLFGKGVDHFYRALQKKYMVEGAYFYSSIPFCGIDIAQNQLVKEADVIYIHWVAGEFSNDNLEKLAKTGKPIFFFMHDMWPFTGGCHHSLGCEKYSVNCKNCKMFNWNNPFPSYQLQKKEYVYSKYSNIHFISPSKWMAGCAKMSFTMRNKTIYNIPNVIDEDVFKPIEKKVARMILNLPIDATIITFGCIAGQGNPFKGWSYLESAINKTNIDNALIVVYGSGYNQETVDKVKYPIKFLGRVYDDIMLSLISNVGDVFVTPSLCENYSLTILESILCGTPVVGFDTTGVPELVKTGETGYLAKFKNSDDLAKGIEQMIDAKLKKGEWENYSSNKIIDQHLSLIHKYLD